jgi:hypothetical protein
MGVMLPYPACHSHIFKRHLPSFPVARDQGTTVGVNPGKAPKAIRPNGGSRGRTLGGGISTSRPVSSVHNMEAVFPSLMSGAECLISSRPVRGLESIKMSYV